MPMTRAEIGDMSETALLVAADRLRENLRSDWQRGAPGRLSDVYDLALVYAEAVVRGSPLPSPMLPGQLELDIGESPGTARGTPPSGTRPPRPTRLRLLRSPGLDEASQH